MSIIIKFPRASARPAGNPAVGSSHSRQNYPAGLSFTNCTHSGALPDSVPGGPRFHPRQTLAPRVQRRSLPPRRWTFPLDVFSMFLAGCGTVALLTLVLL